MSGITATIANADGPDSVGNFIAERYSVTNGQPTVTAALGAGTLGTATLLSGYDGGFAFRVTTGSSALLAGTLVTVVLANTLSGTPNPTVSPVDTNAAALAEAVRPWAVADLGTIQVRSGSLTAATAYTFQVTAPDALVSLAQGARWVARVNSVRGSLPIKTESLSGGTATLGVAPIFGSGELVLIGEG